MEQEPSVRVEQKLKFILFYFPQMCRNRIQYRIHIGRFDGIKFIFIFSLDIFTDGEKLILNVFVS